MQITFDTTTVTDDEVRGIFALLDTVRPSAFDPGPFGAEEVKKAVEGKWPSGYSAEVNGELVPVEEKIADKGWVAGPSEAFVDDDYERKSLAMFKKIASYSSIDANGLVWDERIHASSKALNADGTWRTKRGVDKALVASVEAELRQRDTFEVPEGQEAVLDEEGRATGETVAVAAPPAPPPPPAPAIPEGYEPVYDIDGNPTGLLEPVSEPTPAAPISPFVALMKRVTTAQGAGKLTAQRVKELLESLDKKSIMDLRTDEDALASFAVLLDGEGV